MVVIFRVEQLSAHGIIRLTLTPKLTSEKFVKTSVITGQQQLLIQNYIQLYNLNKKTKIKMCNVEMHLLQGLLIIFIPLNTAVALSN